MKGYWIAKYKKAEDSNQSILYALSLLLFFKDNYLNGKSDKISKHFPWYQQYFLTPPFSTANQE